MLIRLSRCTGWSALLHTTQFFFSYRGCNFIGRKFGHYNFQRESEEGADQTLQMHRLVCTFFFIQKNSFFSSINGHTDAVIFLSAKIIYLK